MYNVDSVDSELTGTVCHLPQHEKLKRALLEYLWRPQDKSDREMVALHLRMYRAVAEMDKQAADKQLGDLKTKRLGYYVFIVCGNVTILDFLLLQKTILLLSNLWQESRNCTKMQQRISSGLVNDCVLYCVSVGLLSEARISGWRV